MEIETFLPHENIHPDHWKIDYHPTWSIKSRKLKQSIELPRLQNIPEIFHRRDMQKKIFISWERPVRKQKQLLLEDSYIVDILRRINNTEKYFEDYTARQIFFSESKQLLEKLWELAPKQGIYKNFLIFLLDSIRNLNAEDLTKVQLKCIEQAFKTLLDKEKLTEGELDRLENLFLENGIQLFKLPEGISDMYEEIK